MDRNSVDFGASKLAYVSDNIQGFGTSMVSFVYAIWTNFAIVDGSIADGGAAMTAYARMQFSEMSEKEVDRVSKALLKYCELDTFAMVLIFQYWHHEIKTALKKTTAA